MILEIRSAIRAGAGLGEMRDVLLKYQALGVTQSSMEDALDRLRAELDGPDEDRVLDLLDFVVGYCAKHNRLW